MTDFNPHVEQMAHESMARTLNAQTRAIWPQEKPLFARYGLAPGAHVLDAGCGTGEASARVAELYPRAEVLGVDILDVNLDRARATHGHLAPRVRFENRSIFELGLPDRAFDLALCRHVLHSVPHAELALAELLRVTKSGGWIHVIPEDYGMLFFERHTPTADRFWREAPGQFGASTGTDVFVGRHAFGILSRLGVADIAVDYVVVDTVRVPRETFAEILEAWRDGYVDAIAGNSNLTAEEARAGFEASLANIRDPHGYAAWMVPVVSGRVP